LRRPRAVLHGAESVQRRGIEAVFAPALIPGLVALLREVEHTQQAGIVGMARKVRRFAGRAVIRNDIAGFGGAEAPLCKRSVSAKEALLAF